MLDIASLMTISTAHISEQTALMLEFAPQKCDMPVYAMERYGWLIFVCSQDETPYDDLNEVAKFAEQHHCEWVRLDPDGDIVDGLPVYDW